MALESMRIVTGCKTPEQFVAAFQRFCDAKTCFIPSADTRPVGRTLAFSLRLSDGTPMLRGTCVVKAAWKTPENPFKRAGVQLEIKHLADESLALFEYLLAQKTAVLDRSGGVVEPVPGATTNQHVFRDKAMDLMFKQGNAQPVKKLPMKPPPIPDRAKTAPPAKRPVATKTDEENPTEPVHVTRLVADDAQPTVQLPPVADHDAPVARTADAASVLPANPFAGLDDNALDELLACTLAEGDNDVDDDLAIPVGEPPRLPAPPSGPDPIAALLALVRPKTEPVPVVLRGSDSAPIPMPVTTGGTQPFALPTRPPAERSLFNLHAMTHDERFWLLCALGAALLVAAIVLASAFVFAA